MPLISSPVAYPPSSSPPAIQSDGRKRPNPSNTSPPAKRRLLGGSLFGAKTKESSNNQTKGQANALSELENPPCYNPPPSSGPFIDDDDDDISENHTTSSSAKGSFDTSLTSIGSDIQETTADNHTSARSIVSLSTSGKRFLLREKVAQQGLSYERLIAQRSTTKPGRATTSYYGIDIHNLLDEANTIINAPRPDPPREDVPAIVPSVENGPRRKKNKGLLWTEKYRARKFTDLIGDERTHRSVMRWLKSWDSIVFPGNSKLKSRLKGHQEQEETSHKKILLITGPPGLGKTTLAHVCAKQAGYEVVEINASDERSRDVVKGRIKDCLGTENVRGTNVKIGPETKRKAGRPVCVIVDEVDGVVSGSGGNGGEGGFMKALVDLVMLDQKNSSFSGQSATKKRKGDRFRLLRPMILVCNDVYHPSLRPLRSSGFSETIHIRKPPLDMIIARMKSVFEKEGVAAETDGVRRLCEATWGIASRKDRSGVGGSGDGDIRGVLVVGEWAASKLRTGRPKSTERPRLTKQWIEQHMIADLASGGSGARGLGRGGVKEAASRVFMEGAGFPKGSTVKAADHISLDPSVKPSSVSDLAKGRAISLLREVIDTSGEPDRVLTDVFTAYPTHSFQDDTFLSKPNEAYEWLHFHDTLSSKVHSNQEWELAPYLSQSILGFHYLFGSSTKQSLAKEGVKAFGEEEEQEPLPFSGPRADFDAHEMYKQNIGIIQSLQSSLSIPLHQSFRSPESVATDLLPHLVRIVTPEVKPVLISGGTDQGSTASVRREGERAMVKRAAEAMGACGVSLERSRVEDDRGAHGGFIYRMEP